MMIGAAFFSLAACSSQKINSEETAKSKSLVVYYSQTGATQQVANIIAKAVGADIDSVQAEIPYNGDFNATIARCQKEMATGEPVALKPLTLDVANYDTLYVGAPVWFGTMALPMASWMKTAKLDGKVIIPFVTFGSGGLETTIADMKKAQPKASFLKTDISLKNAKGETVTESIVGYGVRNARVDKAAAEVEQFLVNIGVKQGCKAEYVAFGEPRQVSADDKALWDKTAGNYPMPLGKPVSVKDRKTANGTQYCFLIEGRDAQGNAATSEVFVIAYDNKDVEPEFTHVVR